MIKNNVEMLNLNDAKSINVFFSNNVEYCDFCRKIMSQEVYLIDTLKNNRLFV